MQSLLPALPSLLLHLLLAPTTATLAPAPQPAEYTPDLRCSSSPLLGTPSYGSTGALFTICAEQEIHAPIHHVYAALLDYRAYSRWNTFVVSVALADDKVRCAADVALETRMTFLTRGLLPLGLTSESVEVVSVLEEERDGSAVNAWRYDDGAGGKVLRAEHPNLLSDLGGGWTRYVSYETYYGGGSVLTGLMRGRLQEQFEKQGRDLKAWVEGGRGEGGCEGV